LEGISDIRITGFDETHLPQTCKEPDSNLYLITDQQSRRLSTSMSWWIACAKVYGVTRFLASIEVSIWK
jgi:hypothetical protein